MLQFEEKIVLQVNGLAGRMLSCGCEIILDMEKVNRE